MEAKVIIIHIFAKTTRFNQSKKDMKFTLLVVGRTVEKHYITAINDYVERTKHYVSFDMDRASRSAFWRSVPRQASA